LAELNKAMKFNFPEIQSLNLKFKTDLSKFKYKQFNLVLALFDKYDKHGIMPFDGSHADQPAQLMEVFSIIENLRLEDEKRVVNNVKT